MIYNKHLEDYAVQYLKSIGVECSGGRVPAQYRNLVEDKIADKLKRDREHTRRKEEFDLMHIGKHIEHITGKFTIVESHIEDFLYNEMKRRGIDKYCEPQKQIGKKRVDFAFECARLVVECDGKEYHHVTKKQIEDDQARDRYLARKGWRVLHIEGLAIRRNVGHCVELIIKELEVFMAKEIGK